MEVIGSGSIWKYKNERCAAVSTWNLNDKLNWGRGQLLWFFFFFWLILHTRLAFVWRTRGKPGSQGLSVSCVISTDICWKSFIQVQEPLRDKTLKPNCKEFVHLWKSYFEKSFFISNLQTTSSILCLDNSILLPIVVMLHSDKVLTYAQKNPII